MLRLTLLYAGALCERGWTQKDYARDVDGNPVQMRSPLAACLCIDAAVMLAAEATDKPRATRLEIDAELLLVKSLGVQLDGLVPWNDAPERTQAEVVQVLRDAADLAGPQ